MNDPKTYNLLAIGAVPPALRPRWQLRLSGNSVALVDKQQDIGGAGINTGTVPSKTLRETALTLSGLRSRNLYGVDLSLRREVTVADFLGHEETVTADPSIATTVIDVAHPGDAIPAGLLGFSPANTR